MSMLTTRLAGVARLVTRDSAAAGLAAAGMLAPVRGSLDAASWHWRQGSTLCFPLAGAAALGTSLWLPAVQFFSLAWTPLMPAILMTGKSKASGKNKRFPKAANHGSRPCSHIGRRQRAAAIGRVKYMPKK